MKVTILIVLLLSIFSQNAFSGLSSPGSSDPDTLIMKREQEEKRKAEAAARAEALRVAAAAANEERTKDGEREVQKNAILRLAEHSKYARQKASWEFKHVDLTEETAARYKRHMDAKDNAYSLSFNTKIDANIDRISKYEDQLIAKVSATLYGLYVSEVKAQQDKFLMSLK